MIRLLFASLIASTALVAPSAQAQSQIEGGETAALRAQIEELQAQIQAMAARLDQMEAEADVTAAPVAVTAPAPAATPAPAASAPEIAFAGAPEIEADGGWSFKPFGRFNIDAGTVSFPDGLGRSEGFGSRMRRARLGVEGTVPGGFGYKMEVDFADGSAEMTDGYVTYQDDNLEITLGQHNNLQSMEELTSSRWSSFIERASFTDAFGFQRRMGLSADYSAGDVILQAGVFTDNAGELPNGNWSLDGRAVYVPKIGETQLHFGGSVHLTHLESGSTVRYRQRPVVQFTSERPLATPNIAAEREFGLGLEAAMVSGRFHAASEAFWQQVETTGAPAVAGANPGFFGGFVEVGYYLTPNDSRGYRGGRWNRTRPASPVDEGGIGAWQLNLRYDHLDLNDGAILGGTQDGYLASLVWVPTDFTRLMLNYAHLEYGDSAFALPSGSRSWSADVLAMRGQIDF